MLVKKISRVEFWVIIFIIFISLAVYYNSLENSFVYDDQGLIVYNKWIKSLKNIKYLFLKEYLFKFNEFSYRPFVTLTYFLDYSIWKLNPFGYHLVNIILHTLNVIFIYLFSYRFLFKRILPSVIASLIFAVHPVLTEAVNSINYREDLLALFFFIPSLMLYIVVSRRYFEEEGKERGLRYIFYYSLGLLFYLFSLLSKEMALTLPFILILYDFTFRGFKDFKIKEIIKNYSGYILITIFYLFLRFYYFKNPEALVHYTGGSFWIDLFTLPRIILSYIKLVIFPLYLNADHIIIPSKSLFELPVIITTCILILFFLLIWKSYRFSQSIFFSSCWFFIILLPVLNLVPIANPLAERYLYIPFVGFSLVMGIFFTALFDRNLEKRVKKIYQGFIISSVVLLLIFYSTITIKRNSVWKNDFTLWSKTAHDSPISFRARYNLGLEYEKKGLLDEAEKEYRITLMINSKHYKAHKHIGIIYLKKSMLDIAEFEFKEALRIKPDYADAYFYLAKVLGKRGLIDDAMSTYQRALEVDPEYYEAKVNLGILYIKKGFIDKGIDEFKKALDIQPDSIEARANLGSALYQKQRFQEAVSQYEKALELNNNLIEIHYILADIYIYKLNNKKGGLNHLMEILKRERNGKIVAEIKKKIQELKNE